MKSKAEYNDYMNNYMKQRYDKRRKEAIAKLGGKCALCGITRRLEFDHINPHTKEFTIARASSFSEERWQEEIKKCQLLCHDCHVTKHRSNHPCGDARKYWRGCKCDLCRAAYAQHCREYRKNRSTIKET